MLESLWSVIALDEALIRMLATAAVIIAVTCSVELFGPVVGGILAGLPITLGPGFYFLIAQAPTAFIGQAAAYSLLSLCATQCFLLTYILTAQHTQPARALTFAILSWGAVAALLHPLPPTLWLGASLFALTTLFCLRRGRIAIQPAEDTEGKAGLVSLLLRGLLAGLLVAGVTAASHLLGATTSGLLLSFPIGYSVISVTLHQKIGRITATTTLYSALIGTTSLAFFCGVLSLAISVAPPYAALGIALVASATVTSTLAFRRRNIRSA